MTVVKAGLSIDQVNYLNIGLMIGSAAVAVRWPFETFLFAYIVLGPLHYLTEISWLHDRHYFTRRRYDYLLLIVAACLVTLVTFLPIPDAPSGTVVVLSFAAFATALVTVLSDRMSLRVLVGVGGSWSALSSPPSPPSIVSSGLSCPRSSTCSCSRGCSSWWERSAPGVCPAFCPS